MFWTILAPVSLAPDWCFGLFKRLYRRTRVGKLSGIAKVMNDSAKCNIAQVVSNEDGSIVVPTYNWTNFFASHFKKIIGIKKLHHLHFTSLEPGICYVKERADTQQTRNQLLKSPWMPDRRDLSSIIQPKGLSPKRQWYLHDQIGPFCPENDRNITCPFQQFPNQSAGKQSLILEIPSQPVTSLQQNVLGSVKPAIKLGTTADPALTKKYNPKSFLFNFVISRHLYLSYTRDLYGCSDIIVIISELTLVCLLADIYIYILH